MAIEVRIPTILCNYTEGAKSVQGSGGTLAEVVSRPERFARFGGSVGASLRCRLTPRQRSRVSARLPEWFDASPVRLAPPPCDTSA